MTMTAQDLCGVLIRILGVWFFCQTVFLACSLGLQMLPSAMDPAAPGPNGQMLTMQLIYIGANLILSAVLLFCAPSIVRLVYRKA